MTCTERNDLPFSPSEKLLRRVHRFHIDGEVVLPDTFKTDFQRSAASFNRSKVNSNPLDVITPKPRSEWGAASLRHEQVPSLIEHDGGRKFIVSVQHCVENGNDAHTEVRLTREGKPFKESYEPPDKVHLRIKTLLAEALVLELLPTESE